MLCHYRNLVSKQIKDMMEDLRNELDRRERKRSEAAGQLTTGEGVNT